MGNELPLAITQGEAAGIGVEITLKAWQARKQQDLPAFFLIADVELVKQRMQELKLEMSITPTTPEQAREVFEQSLPVVPLKVSTNTPKAGEIATSNPEATIESIKRAVRYVQDNEARAIVTNPIEKSVLYKAGFTYPGHTEFLASLSPEPVTPVMMLACDELKVVPLTVHIPLKAVSSQLSEELILETTQIVVRDLQKRFAIKHPRIAIAGLNPHAGENGHIGTEENEIIRPAVKKLQAQGIEISGPYPADTLFHEQARAAYDVVIGTYHDQALIAIKTLAFHSAVNVTLGLPWVRTSPDHGTALDIASKGIANPGSLISAIRMANQMAKRSHGTN